MQLHVLYSMGWWDVDGDAGLGFGIAIACSEMRDTVAPHIANAFLQ